MQDGGPWFNDRLQEKLKYRVLLPTTPGVTTWGGRDRKQTEKQDLGHMPLLRCVGGMLWGFWDRARLVN